MLAGKIAFVTGAGGGIGKATCQLLAEAGAKVVASDCNVTSAKQTISLLKGDDHMALRTDVSNGKDVSSTFNNIMENYYTPPSIVVNAAGIIKDNFLLNLTEEDFDKVIDVNLKGTFLVTQKACKLLVDAGKPGSIINISSIVGKKGNRGQCNYASSKAAVETFSKCVAMEMARYGIRCNTVLPGFISTSMTEAIPDKVKDMFHSLIPLRKFGTPEEVGEVIKFLASDASSYVTGTSVFVSGGLE
ncbi:estradiol 17-beta-dehydrogenase 8 [Planococcus citri]|uniref:estradiol 17-beta-dehydrogenase 8 n=1 Tax=Planococcus citri TaxID=170843 RepID=UPI0031F9CC9A